MVCSLQICVTTSFIQKTRLTFSLVQQHIAVSLCKKDKRVSSSYILLVFCRGERTKEEKEE